MMDLTGVTEPKWKGNTSEQRSLPLETRRRRHVRRRHNNNNVPNNQTTVALWENDSIDTILKTMEKHRQSASVQERACAILGRLSRFRVHNDPQKDRAEIGSAGGIQRIVDAMQLHPQNKAVQRQGCYALRHLVSGNDDNNDKDDNKRRVMEAPQGVETVIKAMNHHTSDAILLRHAFAVLSDLCGQNKEDNSRKKRREERKRRTLIGQAGGAEAVTNAMRRHPTASSLFLLNAYIALRNLSFLHKQNRIRIAQAGGIELILHTMRQHRGSRLLMKPACDAIAGLSCDNADNKRRVFQAGGVKVLVDAMERHSFLARVQDAATRALFILSFERNNRNEIAQKTATEAIQEAQRRFPSLQCPPMILQRLLRLRRRRRMLFLFRC